MPEKYEKVHCKPRTGRFLLIGKKNLELSDSMEPSFHIRECSRPRVLIEQYQRGVDVQNRKVRISIDRGLSRSLNPNAQGD